MKEYEYKNYVLRIWREREEDKIWYDYDIVAPGGKILRDGGAIKLNWLGEIIDNSFQNYIDTL